MTKRLTGRARRMAQLRETAEGLRRSGLMTSTDYDKITAKHVDSVSYTHLRAHET